MKNKSSPNGRIRRRLGCAVDWRWRDLVQHIVSVFCLALPAAHAADTASLAGAAPVVNGSEDFTAMSLEELGSIRVPTVVGASKHEQKITEAPSSVTIVTKQDIKEYGYRTLADVLNGVRGLYVTYDRGYHFLGIRGVNRLGDFGGRTLININGHRVNEPIFDSSFLGYDFPLDVDLIERVEVIRGPGSSLYGNNAFFGIINVVTRSGRDIGGKGVEASGSFGQWDSYSGRFSYGNKFTNGVELLLSGSYYESAGNPKLVFPPSSATGFPGAVERNHDGQSARNFFASVSYNGLTIEGLYGRRDKELPNGPYAAEFNDGRNKLWDERAYAEVRYSHDLPHDYHVLARAYFDHYTYEGTFAFDYGAPIGLAVNRDTPLAQWAGGEIQVSKTLWDKHRLTLGVEGRYDLEQHQENFDVSPPVTYLDLSKSLYSVGAYAQDEFRILKNLTLNAGVRYDFFSTFGSTVNPRAGLIYEPWESSTFKALYGQAYRAPNAYEFDFDNVNYRGNNDLKPETIRSYELVWEQTIAQNYRLTSTLFYDQVEDLITQDVGPATDPRLVFNNTDSVDVKGGGLELEGHWKHGFRARASYTFAEAVDNETGRLLENSPKHVGKLQLTMPIYPEKAFAGFELIASSARQTAQRNELSGHVLANVTLFSHQIARNLEVSASVYNVFDKKYHDPASPDFAQELNPQDGRTFRVKLTYKF